MRDRLIEILEKIIAIKDENTDDYIEWLADELLANGAIVPPCKVGDTVYAISESRIEECHCYEIMIHGSEMSVETEHNCDYDCKGCPFSAWGQDYSGEHSCQGEYGIHFFNFEDFGKTVFLTREEAEKAIQHRPPENLVSFGDVSKAIKDYCCDLIDAGKENVEITEFNADLQKILKSYIGDKTNGTP